MIFKIPPSKYSNYYKVARFELTWNLTIILTIFLPILAVILFALERNAALPTFVGFIICIAAILFLKRTGNYEFTAKFYCIVGLLMNQYSLLFLPKALHFADPIWMVIIVFFTYFTLGKIWGSASLVLNLLGASIYILFFFTDNLGLIATPSFGNLIALAINFIFCSILFTFLIFQFLKLNKYAEDKYVAINRNLKNSNDEKTILLKEVHHRVKNNLQVIISLMRLKSLKGDENTTYSDTIDRIRSMSLIHEKIYQTSNFANIDLVDYLESLISDIIDSHSVSTKISYDVKSNINALNMKSLVPVALMFNELISNSIKHAFSGRSNGAVSIVIDAKGSQLELIYQDNGNWVEPKSQDTLGMELIESLAEQLLGTFELSKKNGTKYTFTFELEH